MIVSHSLHISIRFFLYITCFTHLNMTRCPFLVTMTTINLKGLPMLRDNFTRDTVTMQRFYEIDTQPNVFTESTTFRAKR